MKNHTNKRRRPKQWPRKITVDIDSDVGEMLDEICESTDRDVSKSVRQAVRHLHASLKSRINAGTVA